MFMFSICETIFMCSMSMSFFYSWQTYSHEDGKAMSSAEREKHKPEVIEAGFREVLVSTGDFLSEKANQLLRSGFCEKCKIVLDPILGKLEGLTGRGGNMTQGQYSSIAMSQMRNDSPSKSFIDYQDDDDEIVNIEEGFGRNFNKATSSNNFPSLKNSQSKKEPVIKSYDSYEKKD